MPPSRTSRREDSKGERIAPPPSATKSIMAVVEVCSVPYEDAYRVLQNCNMDVQSAIERFLNGEEKWSQVTKKRKPSKTPKATKTSNQKRAAPARHHHIPGAYPPPTSTPSYSAWDTGSPPADTRRPPPTRRTTKPTSEPPSAVRTSAAASSSSPRLVTPSSNGNAETRGGGAWSQWSPPLHSTGSVWNESAPKFSDVAKQRPAPSYSQQAQEQAGQLPPAPPQLPPEPVKPEPINHVTEKRPKPTFNYADAVKNKLGSSGSKIVRKPPSPVAPQQHHPQEQKAQPVPPKDAHQIQSPRTSTPEPMPSPVAAVPHAILGSTLAVDPSPAMRTRPTNHVVRTEAMQHPLDSASLRPQNDPPKQVPAVPNVPTYDANAAAASLGLQIEAMSLGTNQLNWSSSPSIPTSTIPTSVMSSSALPSSTLPNTAVPHTTIPNAPIHDVPTAHRTSPSNEYLAFGDMPGRHDPMSGLPQSLGNGFATNSMSGLNAPLPKAGHAISAFGQPLTSRNDPLMPQMSHASFPQSQIGGFQSNGLSGGFYPPNSSTNSGMQPSYDRMHFDGMPNGFAGPPGNRQYLNDVHGSAHLRSDTVRNSSLMGSADLLGNQQLPSYMERNDSYYGREQLPMPTPSQGGLHTMNGYSQAPMGDMGLNGGFQAQDNAFNNFRDAQFGVPNGPQRSFGPGGFVPPRSGAAYNNDYYRPSQ